MARVTSRITISVASQPMRDLNDLYYFVQVVDHGGFAPAGRALGMPKSRLSRRIALLEARLGTRLIQRSTRRFKVTEAGRTYYGHCKAMLVEADAADEAIAMTQAEPRGIVRVSCPVALLEARMADMFAAFLVRYPQVVLQVQATDRRVDPIGEGVDIAIRVRPPPLQDSDLVLRVLADRGQCLVASPALLERCEQVPQSPADLADLPSMDMGTSQGEHAWQLLGPDAAQATVRHQPRLVTDSMPALRKAALAGVGVVQLPRMVRAEFASGELTHVLPGWEPRREIIHAVYPSRRGQLPAVRALLELLVAQFQALDED